MLVQLLPSGAHRSHCFAKVGDPTHVPLESIVRTLAVEVVEPEIAGKLVAYGDATVTTADGDELTDVAPRVSVAVSVTTSVEPMSPGSMVYALSLAPIIGAQFDP